MEKLIPPNLAELSECLVQRLTSDQAMLAIQWKTSFPVRHLILDDLLPEPWVQAIAEAFPPMSKLRRYESRKEHKGVGVEMDTYPPILKAVTFAFQDSRVLTLLSQITEIPELIADQKLYASGISSMGEGDFLNPHIDNSGNPFLSQYRRLNGLYYVSPNWNPKWGGNLELWNEHRQNPVVVESRFNRFVLMNTNRTSYHSVHPIKGCGEETRKCVSNYFFSKQSPESYGYSHVTRFRGRPEQPWLDRYLFVDATLRDLYRKINPRKTTSIRHIYDQKKADCPKP